MSHVLPSFAKIVFFTSSESQILETFSAFSINF
jgi:hypothetical protein